MSANAGGGRWCLTKATNAVGHTHPSTIQPTPIHPLNIQFMLAPPIGKVIGKKGNRNPAKWHWVKIQGNWYFFKTKFVFPWNQLGLFSMQQRKKGQFIELASILDLVMFHTGLRSYFFRKQPAAKPKSDLPTDGWINISPFTRYKSERQIGILIVAAQNSIKPCIGLIGANGMQGLGGAVQIHHSPIAP